MATNTTSMPFGVLISGSGTNLQALINGCKGGFIPGHIALVISNNPDAYGLVRAKQANIPTQVINHRAFPDRVSFDNRMAAALEKAEVKLVCLAGFMRILTTGFVNHFQGRLLNIHPSLLPAFPGLGVQQQAIDAGARFSGTTVHFVVPTVDAGPIVIQAVVPILADDDDAALAARILKQEHRIFPLAVRWFAQGRLRIENNRVRVLKTDSQPDAALINPPPPHSAASAS